MDILCRDTLPSRAWRDKLSFSSSYAWREERRRVQCHRCVYNNTPQLTEQCTQPDTRQKMLNRPRGPTWAVLSAQWNLSIWALKSKVMLILSSVTLAGGGAYVWVCYSKQQAPRSITEWVTFCHTFCWSKVLVSVVPLPPLTFADISVKRAKVTQLYKPVLSIISLCYD